MTHTWTYGVTTHPSRFNTLLPHTVRSLKAGGFDAPRLFVDGVGSDGGVEYEKRFPGLPVTTRGPDPVGVHGNWILSLWELFVRTPTATRYAIFQDDVICSADFREYLDRTTTHGAAYWNCYTVPTNQTLAPKTKHGGTVDGWYPSNQKGLGALALVFSADGVRHLIRHRIMVDRTADVHPVTGKEKNGRIRPKVDGGIVESLARSPDGPRYQELCHSPSLVAHTGDGHKSTIGNNWPPAEGAESFRGEGFDLLSLLER